MPENSNFRPNPTRSIYIRGTIDQNLIDTLTLSILTLQQVSREPITVYIDSRGGSTASAELLSRLLKATDQDGAPPCWIITVATGRAASAAADLLTEGNYALVYPETIVHFHGIRYSLDDPLTLEAASFMAESLKLGNDQYAFALARRSISRFLLRFLDLRSGFADVRARFSNAVPNELHCLYLSLCDRVSPKTVQLVEQALQRYHRYDQLADHVAGVWSREQQSPTRFSETEAAILRAILNFELATNTNPAWTFEQQGLRQLQDDFLLLIEYLKPQQAQSLELICNTWGDFFLTPLDQTELESLPEEQQVGQRLEKLKPLLQPFWFFFVALCHVLQEGENELTAYDCYWLGLVDEIIGDLRLPNLRLLVEFAPSDEEASPE